MNRNGNSDYECHLTGFQWSGEVGAHVNSFVYMTEVSWVTAR